jgi:hypothetical protein
LKAVVRKSRPQLLIRAQVLIRAQPRKKPRQTLANFIESGPPPQPQPSRGHNPRSMAGSQVTDWQGAQSPQTTLAPKPGVNREGPILAAETSPEFRPDWFWAGAPYCVFKAKPSC